MVTRKRLWQYIWLCTDGCYYQIQGIEEGQRSKVAEKDQKILVNEIESKKDEGVYVGVKNDVVSNTRCSQIDSEDCLREIWREMTAALEINKVTDLNNSYIYDESCDFFAEVSLLYTSFVVMISASLHSVYHCCVYQ